MDFALVTNKSIDLTFAALKDALRLPARGNRLTQVHALDFDNDGWLDLLGWGGDGLRVWRNRGNAGFHEMTTDLDP